MAEKESVGMCALTLSSGENPICRAYRHIPLSGGKLISGGLASEWGKSHLWSSLVATSEWRNPISRAYGWIDSN